MMNALLVALGGALGAVLRYGFIQQFIMRLHPSPFPLGTILVNIIGSFLIGILVAKSADGTLGVSARLLLMTGVLGGFTTFSAFSIDTLQLWQRGEVLWAAGYVLLSVALSLVACVLGYYWVRV